MLWRMVWVAARSLHGGTLCTWAKRWAAARMYSRWVSCGSRARRQPGWSTSPHGQKMPTLPRGGDGGASPPPPAAEHTWDVPSNALANWGMWTDPAQDLAALDRLWQVEHDYSPASTVPLAQARLSPCPHCPLRLSPALTLSGSNVSGWGQLLSPAQKGTPGLVSCHRESRVRPGDTVPPSCSGVISRGERMRGVPAPWVPGSRAPGGRCAATG